MAAFTKSVQNTAHLYNLWEKHSKILIAVSGGPDSIALLHLLAHLQVKYDWQLRIIHINYRLRGEDSLQDEALVRKLGKSYNIPCSVYHPTLTQTSNLEEYLRTIRYRLFETTRTKYQFDLTAVAHTMDDQAETFLMRLLRGSGLTGLRAMQPKTGNIIRPFLCTDRSAIMRYIEQEHLIYRLDTSNNDTRFLRNKIRHELLPYLQQQYNANIKQTLANTAHIMSADYAALASTLSQTLPLPHNNELSFSVNDILHLSPSLQRMTLRKYCTLLRPQAKKIHFAHIEEILKILRSHKGKTHTLLFSGYRVCRKGNIITLTFHSTPTQQG